MTRREPDDASRSCPDDLASSSSDEDNFQDAVEQMDVGAVAHGYQMNLSASLEQCELALNKFLNNDLQGAMMIMRPWSGESLYHSLATSIFEFIPAVLTLDPRQVEVALAYIKHTVALCQQYRRSYSLVESLGTIIRKPNFSAITELEAHAELCYAEALLLQAALSVLEGEDLAGLVRATLKVKASHNSYKTCERILEQRNWLDGRSRRDFESGVRLGMATFNVVISLLPPRIMLLLSFVGFTGDRAAGLAELESGSRAGGLRAPLCDLTLLAVQLVVVHFIAGQPDLVLAERILTSRLQYPAGAFFLLFLGRLQLLRGETSEALGTYGRIAAIPRLWPQLQQLTYWEGMWACSIDLRWREAAQFAGRLLNESAWSRTVYAYSRAAFLLQLNNPTASEIQEIAQLLRSAPNYCQRIAGKSLPMEKFVVRRCQRWAACGQLFLPGLELLCLWNMFPSLVADEKRMKAALKIINDAAKINGKKSNGATPRERSRQVDNAALMHYLCGSLYSAGGRIPEAMKALDRVVKLQYQIQEDAFLVPFALFEVACCQVVVGQNVRARNTLRDIRRNFSGYLLESRLQFRLHLRLEMIPEQPAEEERALQEEAQESSGPHTEERSGRRAER